jgi:UPF0716 protein FxsA
VGKFLLLFIIVPLIEAMLLAKIGAAIGWMNTIGLVVVTGFIGAWLFKLEGGRAWRQWQESLAQGKTPPDGVLGGVLLLLGGALLITPGVITDAVGVLLLLAPTRRVIAAWLLPRLMDKFTRGQGAPGRGAGGGSFFHFQVGGPIPDPFDPFNDVRRPQRDDEAQLEMPPDPKVIDVDFEVVDE